MTFKVQFIVSVILFSLLQPHSHPLIVTVGTASVAVAGLLASTRVTKIPIDQHTFLFFGAGEVCFGSLASVCHAFFIHVSSSRPPSALLL